MKSSTEQTGAPTGAARRRAGLILFAASAALAGCAASGIDQADRGVPAAGLPATGPGADYPVLVGEPYAIAGVTHTPVDTLNYDAVGYVTAEQGVSGYSGAHHTLPVPSYAEVTSLETGRTILVRLERRGPMESNHVLALAPAAMAQLGASAETPVRVRRVNPPENQRALLRAGAAAPLRMDTPMSLVAVLKRDLPAPHATGAMPAAAPAPLERIAVAPSRAGEGPGDRAAVVLPPLASMDERATGEEDLKPETAGEPAAAASTEPSADGGFVVQAAAFSTRDRAERVAAALGATVTQAGRFYRVRTGPFVTREDAEASLAKVRAAGYSDARILTSG